MKKAPDAFWCTHQKLLEALAKVANVMAHAAERQLHGERPSRRLHVVSSRRFDLTKFNFNTGKIGSMSYAILGAGKVGQALATAFARKGIEVGIASRRPVEALAPVAKAIGPTVVPKALRDAVKAETSSWLFLSKPIKR